MNNYQNDKFYGYSSSDRPFSPARIMADPRPIIRWHCRIQGVVQGLYPARQKPHTETVLHSKSTAPHT